MGKKVNRFYIILIFVFLIFTVMPLEAANKEKDKAVAAASKPVNSSLITSTQLKSKFEKKWFKREALLAKKKYSEANNVISELVEVMLNRGIANLPDFSSALVIDSKRALKNGLSNEAVRFCKQAIMLSPKISRFYFELANVHFSNFSVVKGITTYFQAVKVRSRNFMDSMLFKANTLIYLVSIIIFFIFAFTLLIAIKYLKLFLHDISHAFPKILNKTIVKLYTVILILLPLFLNLGIFWEIIYLIVLGFIYGTRKEKSVFYFIAVLLFILPQLITSTLEIYSFVNTGEMKQIYQANQGTWYLETETNLEKMLNKHPDDPDLLISLGLISKKRGDYRRAEKYYLKGLKSDPYSYELNVNLGNVYLALNDTDVAEEYYKTAIDINPQNGTVHYNLNKLYLKLIKLDKADEEFRVAMNLSPDIVEYYSEIIKASSPNFNRLIIDEQVNKSSYYERYRKYVINTKGIASKLLPVKIKGISFENISLVAIILLVFLVFLQILNKSYAFTTVCQKCGGAVCYRCQRSIKDNKLCSQCHYIIVKRGGVDPKSKIIKMLQIKNYVARRIFLSRLISFFFLGTGHILKGLTIRGVIFFFLYITLGFYILIPSGFISDLYITGTSEKFFTFGSYILLLVLAVIYLIALRDIYRSD